MLEILISTRLHIQGRFSCYFLCHCHRLTSLFLPNMPVSCTLDFSVFLSRMWYWSKHLDRMAMEN